MNILGQSVGRLIPERAFQRTETGSIIFLLGTDAPLSSLALRAVAKRAAIGIGRNRTPGGNNSGAISLAFFSLADPRPMPQRAPVLHPMQQLNGEHFDPLYLADEEAVEGPVINAIVAGEEVETVKPPGQLCRAIDLERLANIFRAAQSKPL